MILNFQNDTEERADSDTVIKQPIYKWTNLFVKLALNKYDLFFQHLLQFLHSFAVDYDKFANRELKKHKKETV